MPNEVSSPGPFPPDCARKFVCKRKIASGGFGAVYLADQINLGRPVAIKLLLADRLHDEGQVARFDNEARITASISHPNVIKVLDHGAECGTPWIAYEYVPGRSLRDILDAGALELLPAIHAVIQMCNAIEAAHAKGVLHRDIKPDNVLEVEEGRYKVTDFGISKWTRDGAVKTRTGFILGTPTYVSTEQITGGPASPLSDIYALGVVLFELIVGTPPYCDDNPLQILESHLSSAIPRASDRRSGLPQAIDDVIARAMAKRPSERYFTAGALRADLAKLTELPVTSQATLATTPTAVTGVDRQRVESRTTAVRPVETVGEGEVGRPPRRAPRAAAVVVGLLISSCVTMLWLRFRLGPQTAVTAQESLTLDGEVALVRTEISGFKPKYRSEGDRIDNADRAMVRGSDDLARAANDAVLILKQHLGDVTAVQRKLESQPSGRESAAVALLQARAGAEELEVRLKLSRETRLVEIASTSNGKVDLGVLDATSAAARIQEYRYGYGLVPHVKLYYARVTEACQRALADPGGATSDLGHVLIDIQALQRRTHACRWDEQARQDVEAAEHRFFESMKNLSGREGPLLGETAVQFWQFGESKGTPAGQKLLEQVTTSIEKLSSQRPEWKPCLTEGLALFLADLRGSR